MIVLDTHVWLWWLHDPAQLSPRALQLLEQAEDGGGARVSAISVWEVATKVRLGKLWLPMAIPDWYELALRYQGICIEPVSGQDALASTLLPGELHKDPADRIIVALARRLGALLVTCDRLLLAYPHVNAVW